jgi:hypothetical protein
VNNATCDMPWAYKRRPFATIYFQTRYQRLDVAVGVEQEEVGWHERRIRWRGRCVSVQGSRTVPMDASRACAVACACARECWKQKVAPCNEAVELRNLQSDGSPKCVSRFVLDGSRADPQHVLVEPIVDAAARVDANEPTNGCQN